MSVSSMMKGGEEFFQDSINTKLETIKEKLDSTSLSSKLDGMKSVIAMISQGKDVSSLFTAVVKNVIEESLELKKLIYMYLTHYAQLKPDEALLSINHFQNDLRNQNQFVRALALRVMSSIRVHIITQIIVVSIKKCSHDASPYVRKAACLAIVKVFDLDHDLLDELIPVLEKLLDDKSIIVVGPAIHAFSQVCPERHDLIHPVYRKLCRMLVDCDEWSQIVLMNTLLKYARTQFVSPFDENAVAKTKFYSDEESDEEDEEPEYSYNIFDLDADHRLFLKSCLPLLKNRNSAVVLNVVSVYYHLAPANEASVAVKPLLRIMKSCRESKYIVLCNIGTMVRDRPAMFEGHLKEFFVSPDDPQFVRDAKLDIIALLASDGNVATILKEFRSYTRHHDKKFVCATIRCIGRIASKLTDITESCVHGLMNLIGSKSEEVVSESVLVIRHLLRQIEEDRPRLIKHLVRLLDRINVPVARASIAWIVGEYYDEIPRIAPDAFRKLVKSFVNEDETVKLQILNLGSKIYLKAGDTISLLFQYVLNLSKYDVNYDIRDKARFIRRLLFNVDNSCPKLSERVETIFLVDKPEAVFDSVSSERSRFALGTLSHIVNHRAFGYEPLPEFPKEQPPSAVRDVIKTTPGLSSDESEEGEASPEDLDDWLDGSEVSGDFATESEDSDDLEGDVSWGSEDSEEDSEEGEDSEEDSEEFDDEDEDDDSEESEEEEDSEEFDDDDLSDEEEFSEEDEFSEEEEEEEELNQENTGMNGLEFDMDNLMLGQNSNSQTPNMPKTTALNHIKGGGLEVEYQYSRETSPYSMAMNVVYLTLSNKGNQPISDIKVASKKETKGIEIHSFPEIQNLEPGSSTTVTMNVAFNQQREAKFDISTDKGQYKIKLSLPIGEFLRSNDMTDDNFESTMQSLLGLSEETGRVIECKEDVPAAMMEKFNISLVSIHSGTYRFAAKPANSDKDILVVIEKKGDGAAKVTVGSEDTVFNSILLKEVISCVENN